MQTLLLNILGEPCSKANSRRIVKFGNKIASIKSSKALAYADAFKRQCNVPASQKFTDDVVVTIRIWYASRRPDLDESLILDLFGAQLFRKSMGIINKNTKSLSIDKA